MTDFVSNATRELVALDSELRSFAHGLLINDKLNAVDAQVLQLPRPFADWTTSPLLKSIDNQAQFSNIETTWGFATLSALLTDYELVWLMYMGMHRYLVNTVPLSLNITTDVTSGNQANLDNLQLGPLSIYFIYAGYLIFALTDRNLLERFINLESYQTAFANLFKSNIQQLPNELAERILKPRRQHLALILQQLQDFVYQYSIHLRVGDLILADAIISQLQKLSKVDNDTLAPLVVISPITRLRLVANGSQEQVRSHRWVGLKTLLQQDTVIQRYCSRLLALVALQSTDQFANVSNAVKIAIEDVNEINDAPPEIIWLAVGLLRMYRMVDREIGLANLRERHATNIQSVQDYLWGLNFLSRVALWKPPRRSDLTAVQQQSRRDALKHFDGMTRKYIQELRRNVGR